MYRFVVIYPNLRDPPKTRRRIGNDDDDDNAVVTEISRSALYIDPRIREDISDEDEDIDGVSSLPSSSYSSGVVCHRCPEHSAPVPTPNPQQLPPLMAF